MKRILSVLLLSLGIGLLVQAQNLPKPMLPARLVNDFAAILSPQEQQLLELKLRLYHDSTSTQIYVITIANTDGYTLAQLSPEFFKQWGIGQKDKNNGVLLLIKPKVGREYGDVFIGTGYGMEGVLPDAYCKRIIEEIMLPQFRSNQYYQGINKSVDAIIHYASGEYKSSGGIINKPSALLPLLIFVVLFLVLYLGKKHNKGNDDDEDKHGGIGSLFLLPFLFGGMGGGRRGGFGGGGFGGGGFGGGGGGFSGGGGAGGRW
ncbi:MAG: TPM domain-containing protein [Bacteroidales bacterium]